MRITAISIRNYRSFDDHEETIKLGEMAAFVGRNSSGKSNILQALQLFWGQSPVAPEDFYFGDNTRTIQITVTFHVDLDHMEPVILPYVAKDGCLKLRREFTSTDDKGKMWAIGKYDYKGNPALDPFPDRKLSSARISAFLKSAEADGLRSYASRKEMPLDERSYYSVLGAYWCDHFDEYSTNWSAEPVELGSVAQKAIFAALPAYYYLPVSYTASKMTQDKHSYFQQIYQQILGDVKQLFTEEHADELRKQVDLLYRQSGMRERCSAINQILEGIGGADASVRMHIEIGEPDFDSLFNPAPALRVDDGYDCDIQNKGQGIQRDAIFRLLQVFTQLNQKQKKRFILAIDEPEAFMHPTYKRSLYKSFLKLCETGCQIFYTTHDPAFVSVSRFDDIHTVVMKRDEKQHSSVFSSSFSELMGKEVMEKVCRSRSEDALRKELEHKCRGEQNEGFFADRIILVEGATESYALPIYFSRLGYDLDANNTVILVAQSKTLLRLLCAIFSSCRIPCYCIFDGDKPREEVSIGDEESDRAKAVHNSANLNRELIAMFQGEPEDFPKTTVSKFYTVWERDFEHAIQMKNLNYEALKKKITREEGVASDSKPLVAYHLAAESEMSDFPQDVQDLLASLLQQIKEVECLPLADLPARTNVLTLCDEEEDGAIPVYSSAAGRNTTAEDDTPNCYAYGNFPPDTAFLVHIQGDSMEPRIPNGCYVAVKRVEEWPSPGKIGIFLLDGGEIVCKQYLSLPNGKRWLKSLNPKCASIQLTDDIVCRVRGEVIELGKKQAAIYFVE